MVSASAAGGLVDGTRPAKRPRACSVAGCGELRAEGSQWCAEHGAKFRAAGQGVTAPHPGTAPRYLSGKLGKPPRVACAVEGCGRPVAADSDGAVYDLCAKHLKRQMSGEAVPVAEAAAVIAMPEMPPAADAVPVTWHTLTEPIVLPAGEAVPVVLRVVEEAEPARPPRKPRSTTCNAPGCDRPRYLTYSLCEEHQKAYWLKQVHRKRDMERGKTRAAATEPRVSVRKVRRGESFVLSWRYCGGCGQVWPVIDRFWDPAKGNLPPYRCRKCDGTFDDARPCAVLIEVEE